MRIETEMQERLPAETIYDSPEALDVYLGEIRQRREQRRLARERTSYWQAAIVQIQAELTQAEREGDAEIALELKMVLRGFEARLAGVPQSLTALPAAQRQNAVVAVREDLPLPVSENAPVEIPLPVQPVAATLPEGLPEVLEPETVLPELLCNAEAEARLLAMRHRMNTLKTRWQGVEWRDMAHQNGELNRPLCFRLRALACAVNGLYAEAGAEADGGDLRREIEDLRGCMELARTYADDRAVSLPFDSSFWNDAMECLPAAAWSHLEERYECTAEAQEVWNWYSSQKADLNAGSRAALVQSVAAAQQELFYALEAAGGRDGLQSALYGSLLDEAKHVGFLSALHPDTPDEELAALRSELLPRWKKAQADRQQEQARREREEGRTRAQAAFDMLLASRPALGASERRLTQDRKDLFACLDACIEAGIPPTSPRIRNPLLANGLRLLRDQVKYGKFLKAVQEERLRQGMDKNLQEPEEEDDLPDSDTERYRSLVADCVAGQKILILGGTPRQRVCDDLKAVLGCEVEWPMNKKGDKSAKFQTEIKKADIVLALKNFISHELAEKSREWTKANGSHFILLLRGYGVNRIIYELYETLKSK